MSRDVTAMVMKFKDSIGIMLLYSPGGNTLQEAPGEV